MTLPFFLRPSTRLREIDLTQRLDAPASSIGCVFGEYHRGPLKPTYINGIIDNYNRLYGSVADPSLSFAHDTGSAFLSESGNLLVQRVVNSALHAGVHVYLDDIPTNKAISFIPFHQGSETGFEAGVNPPTILNFSVDLITANSFSMTVTDGVDAEVVGPIVYATSHANTMALIASAIQAALNTFGTGGYANYLPEENGSRRRIAIYMPDGQTLSYSGAAVTAGVTQPVTTLKTPANNHIMTIMAENPGKWANDIGVKFTGFDQGIRVRKRLLFNGPLVASNSFTATINNVAIAAPVVFDEDSDTTMAAIAAAISAHADVSTAYVEEVPAGRNNDRSIIIVAQNAGPDTITINSAAVTLGSSQPAVTVFHVLNGSPADGSFNLEVFNRSNVVLPDERYTVTLGSSTDARGVQTRIDSRVNNSAESSINIRVVPNPKFISDAAFTTAMNGYLSNPDLTVPSTIRWLTTGDDGLAVLSSQLRQALRDLDDRIRYPFSILMNSGYTAVEVQQEMVSLAIKRNDCFAILDMPSDMQGTAQKAREYRLYTMNIDSSYGAIYTPDLLIADIATSERRYIPPSGFVGAVYAYNDRVASIAHAPAGLNRGILRNVIDLRVNYKPADEELMHPVGINSIIDKPGNGPVIMGEETLQVKKSLLSSVHARRLVSLLEVTLVDGLDYTLFEPHTEFTRNAAVQLGRNFLKPYRDNGALYDFSIQCNEKNNPPEIIDQDALSYRVFLKVVRAIKGILLDVILTKTGASFSELEDQTF